MVDYLRIIGDNYENAEVHVFANGDPSNYDDIIWDTAAISQVELDTAYLGIEMEKKIMTFAYYANVAVTNGFTSLALGSEHYYDSQVEDQMNLIGSTAAGDTMMYGCRETADGIKTYKLHTNEQLLQVLLDGRDLKLSTLQQFNVKRAEVLACTTEAEILAVTWE